ncbi:MAG: thiamine phosphate synthase [Pseudomonadota bacterium]
MALNREALRLYLVTDPVLCAQFGVVETVEQAVRGGVTCVQLRDKTAGTKELIALGKAILSALKGTGVPLLINDDVEAAKELNAHGLHVGQSDADVAHARAVLGPQAIIGLSCETAQHIHALDESVVDYLGIGTVFATQTKSNHSVPMGLNGLADLCALTSLPKVAIGGLKVEHQNAVLEAGADGLAVVSAICGQPDPRAAARAFFQT